MFSILKMKDKLVLTPILHKKTIWWCHFASTEPEAYLEPSRASIMELFASTVNGYKPLPILAKMLHHIMFDWVLNMSLQTPPYKF